VTKLLNGLGEVKPDKKILEQDGITNGSWKTCGITLRNKPNTKSEKILIVFLID